MVDQSATTTITTTIAICSSSSPPLLRLARSRRCGRARARERPASERSGEWSGWERSSRSGGAVLDARQGPGFDDLTLHQALGAKTVFGPDML
jgi:hypothetical protein